MNIQDIEAIKNMVRSKELLKTGVQILENLSQEEYSFFRNYCGSLLYLGCYPKKGIYYLQLPVQKEQIREYNCFLLYE